MAVWLASVALGIALTELCTAVFTSAWFREQWSTAHRELAVFRHAPDEDERQRAALRSGISILRFSSICLAFVAFVAVLVAAPAWTLRWDAQTERLFLVGATVSATGWWVVRAMHQRFRPPRNQSSSHSYGLLARVLHWLALEPQVVRELTFEIEKSLFLPSHASVAKLPIGERPADGAVYVCGLARSGTTMLLEILDRMDCFRSLTYRDMPFVLAPNLWRAVTRYSHRDRERVERAHGDGVLVDFDSAEAFEEVFWRTFSDPIRPGKLTYGARPPSEEALRAFADFRAIVANPRSRDGTARPHKRYLSKNNNNLLRLRELSADPNATILLVYRDPVATARSLHRQHMRFCARAEDHFTRRYMAWLGHREFGPGHRPFHFAAESAIMSLAADDLNYWLAYWAGAYRCVLTQLSFGVRLVNHDAFRDRPREMMHALAGWLELAPDCDLVTDVLRKSSEESDPYPTDSALLEDAYAVYGELTRRPENLIL